MIELKGKYEEMPITLKASLWFIVSNILLKGISFFTAPLFATILSEDEYGRLTIFLSYNQIVLILATWEIGLSPFQRGLFKFKEDKKLLQSVIILFAMLMSLLVFIVVFLFGENVSDFTEMPLWLMAAVFVYILTYTSYISWMTEKKVEYDYKSVSIITIVLSLVQVSFSLLAVFIIKKTASIYMLFYLIPGIIINIIITAKRLSLKDLIQNKGKIKQQLHFLIVFSWPLVVHSLSYLVLAQADRIMIGKITGNSEAGLYGVAYSIASVIIIVQSAVLQVMSPWIYQKMDKGEYYRIQATSSRILLIVSILYLIFMLIAPDVIFVMYPQHYWQGIWCIPPISLGIYFMFMYSLFVSVEECLDNTKYVAIVSITCALINVVLNYAGIKIFGYIACAYTTLICYMLFAIGHFLFMTKIVKEKRIEEKIYDGRLFLLVSLAMLLFMVLITIIYDMRIVRYILFFLLCLIIALFREEIMIIAKDLGN